MWFLRLLRVLRQWNQSILLGRSCCNYQVMCGDTVHSQPWSHPDLPWVNHCIPRTSGGIQQVLNICWRNMLSSIPSPPLHSGSPLPWFLDPVLCSFLETKQQNQEEEPDPVGSPECLVITPPLEKWQMTSSVGSDEEFHEQRIWTGRRGCFRHRQLGKGV